MIKVGIIGYGKMGQIRADAIESDGRGEVAAVYDPNRPSLEKYASAQSAQAIINDPEIDAICVCTPNYENKRLTIAGLGTGKHVFCEKPPAFNAREIEEVREVEAASGKVLMYGFNHRHHSSIKHMKTVIDSGDYGRVLWMRGRYGKSVDEGFFDDWRAKKELSGGGIMLDQVIEQRSPVKLEVIR